MKHLPKIEILHNALDSSQWVSFILDEQPHFSRLSDALTMFPKMEWEKMFYIWKNNTPPYVLSDDRLAFLYSRGCKLPNGEITSIGLQHICWEDFLVWQKEKKYSLAEVQRILFQKASPIHAIALPEESHFTSILLQKTLPDTATVWEFLEALILLEATRLPKIAFRMHT